MRIATIDCHYILFEKSVFDYFTPECDLMIFSFKTSFVK